MYPLLTTNHPFLESDLGLPLGTRLVLGGGVVRELCDAGCIAMVLSLGMSASFSWNAGLQGSTKLCTNNKN